MSIETNRLWPLILGRENKTSIMAADCLRKLFEDYKKAVVHNPQLVSQLELGFRVASYLIAGTF